MFKNRSELILRGGLHETLEAAAGVRVDPSTAGGQLVDTSLTLGRRDLGERMGQLVAAIERAWELPDVVSDACDLRYRLALRQAKLERKQKKLEGEIRSPEQRVRTSPPDGCAPTCEALKRSERT